MDTKHTPGPWSYGEVETDDGPAFIVGGPLVSQFIAEVRIRDRREAEANARVIIAAPDMLALLRELVDIEGPQPGHVEWCRKTLAAIQKATEGAA
jgi:hypothetical protein